MQKLNLCILASLILLEASPIIGKDIKGADSQSDLCPCEYNFRPVCGSDGVTYTNECLLDCYNKANKNTGYQPVTKVPDSACRDCVCQNIDLPVCTLDGLTYPNECELSCENIKRLSQNRSIIYLAYRAPCVGPPCNCTTIAAPVCGTDNILYRNLCVLNCANLYTKGDPIKFQNYGACLDGCQCPDVKQTVCGSDDIPYDNPCLLACQNRTLTCSMSPPITVANNKMCQTCNCLKISEPVCGRFGDRYKTFANKCELDCEVNRHKDSGLTAIAFGACPNCSCTDDYLPVCGTDCKTYKNECEVRCANVKKCDCREYNDPVSIFHYGPCQVDNCDCSYCPKDYVPMCGSDKQTYWNLCWLKCNNDCLKDKSGSQIFLAERGSCSL